MKAKVKVKYRKATVDTAIFQKKHVATKRVIDKSDFVSSTGEAVNYNGKMNSKQRSISASWSGQQGIQSQLDSHNNYSACTRDN